MSFASGQATSVQAVSPPSVQCLDFRGSKRHSMPLFSQTALIFLTVEPVQSVLKRVPG